MKKIIVLFILVCMLLMSSTALAMSQKELNDFRWEAQQTLNSAPSVTWSDLNNDPSAYSGSNIKFKGICVGQQDSVGFKDGNGNMFVIANPLPYRFKLGTEYTVSATFNKMVSVDGDTAAVFSIEQAHLPVMSEWGL